MNSSNESIVVEAIGRLVRQALIALGSAGVATDWLTQSTVDQLVSLTVLALGLAWSWIRWYRGRKNRQSVGA